MMFPKQQTTNRRKPNNRSEENLQVQCEALLRMLNIAYIRIPNAVYCRFFANNKKYNWTNKNVSTNISGLPDLTILLRDGNYICVELKSKTGRLRDSQKVFRDAVGIENFFVCRTFEEFQEVLRSKAGQYVR